MSEKSLRGTRLGSNSLESEVGVEPIKRHIAEYHCPQGHVFSVPFAFDAEIPALWQCKCGAEGLLVDATRPAPAGPSRPAPTGTCCWSAAPSPSWRSCSTSASSCSGPSRAPRATSAAPEPSGNGWTGCSSGRPPAHGRTTGSGGAAVLSSQPDSQPQPQPEPEPEPQAGPGPIWSSRGGSTSGRSFVDDLSLHDGWTGRPAPAIRPNHPDPQEQPEQPPGPAAGSTARRRAARTGPGRSRAGSAAPHPGGARRRRPAHRRAGGRTRSLPQAPGSSAPHPGGPPEVRRRRTRRSAAASARGRSAGPPGPRRRSLRDDEQEAQQDEAEHLAGLEPTAHGRPASTGRGPSPGQPSQLRSRCRTPHSVTAPTTPARWSRSSCCRRGPARRR